MGDSHLKALLVVALLVAAVGAVYDWKKGVIPDWLTLPALLIAPFAHIARLSLTHHPLDQALTEGGYSVGGAMLCAIVPLMLFRQNAIGGGDVKLFAALGAILQPMVGVEAEMYGFFAGAILAPARLAYEGKLLSTIKNSFSILANFFLPKTRQRAVEASALSWFRLGPAIFLGVLFVAFLHWK